MALCKTSHHRKNRIYSVNPKNLSSFSLDYRRTDSLFDDMTIRSLYEKSIRVRRITRKTLIKAKFRQNTKKSSRSARSLVTSDLLEQNTRVIHILATKKATLSAKKNRVKQNHSRPTIRDQVQISNESEQNHVNQSRRQRVDIPKQSHNISDENLALPNLPSEKRSLNHTTHHAVPSTTAAFQFNQKVCLVLYANVLIQFSSRRISQHYRLRPRRVYRRE